MSIFHDQASLMQRARQQLHEKAVNPYAVGMAAAMEQEDDKPPLKKSTITKAHKIAKKVEKAGYEPEGEQIDEIAPLVVGGLAAAAAAPYLFKKFAKPAIDKALDKASNNPNRRLVTGGTVGDLKQAQNNSYEPEGELVDEGKSDKKLPEHERSAARLARYDNPSGALALGGGQQRARKSEHESRRGVKKKDYKIDEVTLSPRAQAINSGNSPLSRDPRARGGYDPRFDRRPTQTDSPSPTSTGSAPTRPTTPTSAPSTGTYRSPNTGGTTPGGSSPSLPRMPGGGGGGILDTLDKFGRDTAGRVGETIGRTQAGKVPGANIPGLGDIIKGEGGRRGRNQGQQMYDRAKETLGGFLKQNYEYEIINHLVENGFANDGMSAYKIMENMSEEWLQSIVSENAALEYMKKNTPHLMTGKTKKPKLTPAQKKEMQRRSNAYVERTSREMENNTRGT